MLEKIRYRLGDVYKRQALNDDDAQGIINFLKGLKIAGNLINRSVKQGDDDVTYTDEDVMSCLLYTSTDNESDTDLFMVGVKSDSSGLKYILNRDYPVSYTHLDVYKRQHERVGGCLVYSL